MKKDQTITNRFIPWFENLFSGIRSFAHLENQNLQLNNQNPIWFFTSNDFENINR